MVKIPEDIKLILDNYIIALNKNNYNLKKVILFGSYSKGNYSEWSDIDLALVSDKFSGDKYEDRKKIARLTIDSDYRIDPLPFSTKDFNSSNLFIKEIIDTGVLLYSN